MSRWKNLVARWGSGAGETDDVRIDASTNSLQTVSYEHHEVHSGTHYTYRSCHALAKNATLDHLIITPNTTSWAHMTVSVDTTAGEVVVGLYEDTTTSADGALENTVNRNRNVADNNTTEVYEAPTVTGVGTLLAEACFGAGKKGFGGSARDHEEFILKQNTKYLLRVAEQNVLACDLNIVFDWYEHTDKH